MISCARKDLAWDYPGVKERTLILIISPHQGKAHNISNDLFQVHYHVLFFRV